MTEYDCILCRKRGKDWEGSDPMCAFTTEVFDHGNWNCAAMNALRDIAERLGTSYRNDDIGSFGMVPFDGENYQGAIIMAWYKNRGRTDMAVFLTEYGVTAPVTWEIVEEALRYHGILPVKGEEE
jgi:hypothetical protein